MSKIEPANQRPRPRRRDRGLPGSVCQGATKGGQQSGTRGSSGASRAAATNLSPPPFVVSLILMGMDSSRCRMNRGSARAEHAPIVLAGVNDQLQLTKLLPGPDYLLYSIGSRRSFVRVGLEAGQVCPFMWVARKGASNFSAVCVRLRTFLSSMVDVSYVRCFASLFFGWYLCVRSQILFCCYAFEIVVVVNNNSDNNNNNNNNNTEDNNGTVNGTVNNKDSNNIPQVGLAAAEKGARRARRAGRKAAATAATLAHGRSPEIALDLPEALNPLAGRQQVRVYIRTCRRDGNGNPPFSFCICAR